MNYYKYCMYALDEVCDKYNIFRFPVNNEYPLKVISSTVDFDKKYSNHNDVMKRSAEILVQNLKHKLDKKEVKPYQIKDTYIGEIMCYPIEGKKRITFHIDFIFEDRNIYG